MNAVTIRTLTGEDEEYIPTWEHYVRHQSNDPECECTRCLGDSWGGDDDE